MKYCYFAQRLAVLLCLVSSIACTTSGPVQASDADAMASQQRIIAVGDIHGDFDQFIKLIQHLGLVDKKLRWVGGDTHLVQLGDIPDRGPDSRKAMDLLIKLQKSAAKAGGQVTVLIGNHEAMMMTNDLRYVHPGEYAAFKDRNSKARQDAYFQQTIAYIKANTPEEEWPDFNKDYRKEWELEFPLGYVEHRIAWAPTGEYGKWVLSRPAVVKIGDTLFAHGGLSPQYSVMSLSDINTRVRTVLANGPVIPENSIVEDPNGPLWDRGWVSRDQTPENQAVLNSVLQAYDAKRLVIAHTPVASAIIPRFGGRVLLADVGLASHYGSGFAAVEIIGDEVKAILSKGELALPNGDYDSLQQADQQIEAYLAQVIELMDDPARVIRYREILAEAKRKKEVEATSPQQQTGN